MYDEEGEVRVNLGSEPEVTVIPHSECQLITRLGRTG